MPHADYPARDSPEENPPREAAQWQAVVTSAQELQQRRRDIDRGLRRSHYAVVAAAVVAVSFALAALWFGGEARRRAESARVAQQQAETQATAAREASLRLWEGSTHAARLQRSTRAVGQRTEALEIIHEAAGLKPSRELRGEALSALLLPDIGTNVVWREEAGWKIPLAYDPQLEFYIQNRDDGRAIVRRARDEEVVMDEAGLGGKTSFCQFSPDGHLVGFAFGEGQIGVWDWREKRLKMKFEAAVAGWQMPCFDFGVDGQKLWVLAATNLLTELDLDSGKPGRTVALDQPANIVRLSPSGNSAALADGNHIEVLDLSTGKLLASVVLPEAVWQIAWH